MKNKKTLFIALVVICIASVFAFTACKIELNFEEDSGKWDITGDDMKTVKSMYNDFLEDVIKGDNLVVTYSSDGSPVVENVVGTSCLTLSDGIKTYTYVKDDVYYCATDDGYGKYYSVGRFAYDISYRSYLTTIDIINMFDDDATWLCNVKGESKYEDGVEKSTNKMTLSITQDDQRLTLTAQAKDGKVESLTYTYVSSDGEGGEVSTSVDMSFEVGTATFTEPDLTGWYKMQSLDDEETVEGDDVENE